MALAVARCFQAAQEKLEGSNRLRRQSGEPSREGERGSGWLG